MVLICYKKTEDNQFLYEVTALIPIDQLIKELVEIHNLRIKIDQLCMAIEDLAKKGPQKPEELRGLADYSQYGPDDITIQDGLKKSPPQVGTRFVEDETHHRTGWLLDEEITKTMLNAVLEAKVAIHKEQVMKKIALTHQKLLDLLDIFRGVIMMAYPAYHGLGEWEPVRVILEMKEIEGFYSPDLMELLELQNTTLWWAGKELVRGKVLADYIGKNEKTKIIVKLQGKGGGPPVREPLIDQETHKKMLAFYHKKTEEAKKLEDDGEDAYLASEWANPSGLKKQLHGTGDIKWK